MPEQKSLARYHITRGSTKSIGVFADSSDSAFFSMTLKGIQAAAWRRGYASIISLLPDNGSAAVLLSTTAHSFDRSSFDGVVSMDNVGAGYMAAEHLVRQGCRRPAMVCGKPLRSIDQHRYKGFCQALQDYRLPLLPCDIVTAEMIRVMNPLPDGLFFTDDYHAVDCMNSLRDACIDVPGDVAVITVNSHQVASLVTPALTTIDFTGFVFGERAASQLLEQPVRGRPRTTLVPPVLAVRQSSLKSR